MEGKGEQTTSLSSSSSFPSACCAKTPLSYWGQKNMTTSGEEEYSVSGHQSSLAFARPQDYSHNRVRTTGVCAMLNPKALF